MRNHKKLISMLMALAMIVTCLVSPAMASPAEAPAPAAASDSVAVQTVRNPDGSISQVEGTTDLNKEVTIMVQLEGQTTFQQTSDLQLASAGRDDHLAVLAQAENRVQTALSQKIEVKNRYTLLFNGFSFTGEKWMIDAINEMDGVTAFEAPVFELIEPQTAETNLAPSMHMSTDLTKATNTWDLGYTGEGMVVAVVDTGIRQTHEAFSVMPEGGKIDLAYLRDIYVEYGDVLHAGSLREINDIYYNTKLPFNWDYFDGDAIPNHTQSDHGTHVAGIAAGNNGEDFRGVAPDAQIVTMQVFDDAGGAAFDTLMLALEDCVYLGVDAVNMSLGVAAFFTSYESISAYMEVIYEALENAGVAVCAAAGNDATANYWTNPGVGFNSEFFAWNVDYGTIGAPSTFPGSFAVASLVNVSGEGSGYLIVNEKEYYPTAIAGNPTFGALENREYEMVYVGLGSPEEIEAAGGVEGKIAITQRGVHTFTLKCENAAAAGAVACIIFNNAPGALSPSVASPIPFGAMSMEDGLALIENFADGVHGTVTVNNGMAYRGLGMASSSSWGTTADLLIKPEITAPGDNITSAIGFGDDASYQAWSGTSMATPHIAGGMLLIKQRLQETFPNKTAAEINALAHTFMMSTAHQVSGFVRQAGAGLMDIEAAVNTEAYINVPGQARPKLELDDSENGKFDITFEVVNFGDEAMTYSIVPSILTERASDFNYIGYRSSGKNGDYNAYNQATGYFLYNPYHVTVKAITGAIMDVTDLCTVTGPKSVTVEPGETVTVNMTIKAGMELMAYIEENFEAGIYLEGYINLKAEEGVDLSVPFLGFVGDWDYVPMFDKGFWWNLPYGVPNMAQMPVSRGTYVGAAGGPDFEQGLGINPYWSNEGQTYLADRHAISPNGDGFYDSVSYIEGALMRNPKTVKLYSADENLNMVQLFHDSTYNYRKEYYVQGWNGGTGYSSWNFFYEGAELAENETGYIVLEAWLDHEEYEIEDNMNGRMIFPVTKDLTAPAVNVVEGGVEIVDANYTAYYAIYADEARTELLYENGVFAMERGVAEFYETDLTTFYVATADYAMNEAFYMVSDGAVYDLGGNPFGHSERTIIGREMINWKEGNYEYSWRRFTGDTHNNPELIGEIDYNLTYATTYGYDFTDGLVADDGTVYVATLFDLYTLNTETWEVTHVATFSEENPQQYTPSVRNIMKNPETGETYAWAYLYGAENPGRHLCKLDMETGALTTVWRLREDIGYLPQIFNWSAEFIDGDTIVIHSDGNGGTLWLVDADDCSLKQELFSNYTAPNGDSQFGVNGTGGNILYNKETNEVYLYGNWSWFGWNRYNTAGMYKVDLDTNTWTRHVTGTGTGLLIHGLFFEDEMKPAEYWVVMELIEAIGEVGVGSGDAIDAAREAYDALPESEKARVANYETLVAAERAYLTLVAEEAALNAAKSYALLVINDLEKEAAGDTCLLNTIEAAREAIGYAASVDEVYAILDSLRLLAAEGCVSNRFSDVAVNAWYHDSVEFVVAFGLMEGMGGKTFAPEGNMTRAQLVTVLYRLVGEPEVDGMVNPFTDVAADTWYTDAVIWAANNGIVTGVTETTFAPNANISREQLVTILYRFFGEPEADTLVLAGYADANAISGYAVDAMAWAVGNGIVNGITETVLAPQGTATRAQIATILMRVILG